VQVLDRFVDKAFVINLKTRPDRRRETEQELRNIGFAGAGFHVVTKPEDPGLFRTQGERGCFESHVAIWQQCLGARNVLVMEDDVQFVGDFAQRVPLLETLPADWDIVYVGYDQHPDVARPIPGRGLVRVGGEFEFIGTHGYMVNGPAIGPLLAACLDISSRRGESGYAITIDGAINIARARLGLASYVFAPPLAIQRASMTDIADPKWFDRVPVLNAAIGQARRIKNLLRRRSAQP